MCKGLGRASPGIAESVFAVITGRHFGKLPHWAGSLSLSQDDAVVSIAVHLADPTRDPPLACLSVTGLCPVLFPQPDLDGAPAPVCSPFASTVLCQSPRSR